jgi:hypothetical protein
LLPAPEFAIEKCLVDFEPGRQARQECDQGFAVRFSGCEVTQHKCSILPDAAARWNFLRGKQKVSPADDPLQSGNRVILFQAHRHE